MDDLPLDFDFPRICDHIERLDTVERKIERLHEDIKTLIRDVAKLHRRIDDEREAYPYSR